MLKRFTPHILAGLLIASCIACTGPNAVPTATLNDKEALALRAATTARQTATALLLAGKITVAQDKVAQAQATAIVEGIRNARAAGDAAAIDAAKTQAENLTAAVQGKPQ